MFVAAWIRRLANSIARNGPHANAPSVSASAVPKSTGTADAVRLNGRASLNHSPSTARQGLTAFIGPPARTPPRSLFSGSGHNPFLTARRALFCKPSLAFSIEASGFRLRASEIYLKPDARDLKPEIDWLRVRQTDITRSRGSRRHYGDRGHLPPAGPAKAVDEERVRAGRGGLRARGPGGLLGGEGASGLRCLLRALRRGVRRQRRVGRRGGPQAPPQEEPPRGERGDLARLRPGFRRSARCRGPGARVRRGARCRDRGARLPRLAGRLHDDAQAHGDPRRNEHRGGFRDPGPGWRGRRRQPDLPVAHRLHRAADPLSRLLQAPPRARFPGRGGDDPPQEPGRLLRAAPGRDDEHHDLGDYHRLRPLHPLRVRQLLHDGEHPVRSLRGVPVHVAGPPRRRRQPGHPPARGSPAPGRSPSLARRGRDGALPDPAVERLKSNFILALALGVAVYLALAVLSGFGDLSAALEDFNLALVPLILGLVLLSYAGRFVRWLYYLSILKVSVPLATNAAIFAAGLSMTISPGKLGEVLKSVFVRQASGAPVARTAPAVVAERATDGTGMVAWGFLGAGVSGGLSLRRGAGCGLDFVTRGLRLRGQLARRGPEHAPWRHRGGRGRARRAVRRGGRALGRHRSRAHPP